ncbi:MAG TPA: hypothetical protein VLJ17_08665 [Xanthobacteraceae bacterium]|nr:hypothetical protein [Xanthobacteraceae bacterium]
MLGDKAYDSNAVRQEIEDCGGEALIPSTASRKIQRSVDKAIYAQRNRIELQPLEKLMTGRDPLRQTHRELRSLCHPCSHSNLD